MCQSRPKAGVVSLIIEGRAQAEWRGSVWDHNDPVSGKRLAEAVDLVAEVKEGLSLGRLGEVAFRAFKADATFGDAGRSGGACCLVKPAGVAEKLFVRTTASVTRAVVQFIRATCR